MFKTIEGATSCPNRLSLYFVLTTFRLLMLTMWAKRLLLSSFLELIYKCWQINW